MPEQTPDKPVPEEGGATSARTPDDAATTPGGAAPAGPATRRSNGAMAMLVPALTFALGLLIGAALVWAGSDRDGDEVAAGPTPTQAASLPTDSPTDRPTPGPPR